METQRAVPETSTHATTTNRLSGRALIGWLAPEDGALWLAGRQMGHPKREEFIRQTVKARAAIEARIPGVDQSDLFRTVPAELADHVAKLERNASSAALFKEGCKVSVVDLQKVCAIQPVVYTRNAMNRMLGVDPNSIASIAAVTLPIPGPQSLPVQFDPTKNAWIFSSPNPNLRILGNFSTEVQPGVPGFGFVVSIQQSYLQVASLHGRYFLSDGYHRAFGLLSIGVSWAPCLVRKFSRIEDLTLPPGLLPQDAFLGEKPPMLTDYSNDEVAAPVEVDTTHKIIALPALEFSALA